MKDEKRMGKKEKKKSSENHMKILYSLKWINVQRPDRSKKKKQPQTNNHRETAGRKPRQENKLKQSKVRGRLRNTGLSGKC